MRHIKILVLAAMAVIAASCSITSKSSFAPDYTQLSIGMEDLEFLGDAEVSVEYDRYLGIFRKLNKINGVEYDGKQVDKVTGFVFQGNVIPDAMLGRALPKVYETYPDAEYIVFVNQSKHKEILFLGAEVEVKARVKVYKFRQK